jgi:hypothetical protein
VGDADHEAGDASGLVLGAYRHVVQDRTKLRLREETPATPE